MRMPLGFLGGLGAGAGLMLLLDPDRGARRRALVRDKILHGTRRSSQAMQATQHDVMHRAQGLAARLRRATASHEPVSDEVLTERVRARLGRVVSHVKAVDVMAHDGNVVLIGPILTRERRRAIAAVSRVPGVRHVEDHFEPHDEPGSVPQLQGGSTTTGDHIELLQRRWSPTLRLLSTTCGGALAAYGLVRRGWAGGPMVLAGVALAARGVTNRDVRDLMRERGNGARPGGGDREAASPSSTAGS